MTNLTFPMLEGEELTIQKGDLSYARENSDR